MSLMGLVILAADRESRKITEKYRAGAAMADNGSIVRSREPFHAFEALRDAVLYINGPLPPANAFVWG